MPALESLPWLGGAGTSQEPHLLLFLNGAIHDQAPAMEFPAQKQCPGAVWVIKHISDFAFLSGGRGQMVIT